MFYEKRSFRPAWAANRNSEQIARAALGLAHEQGLRDADYKLPKSVSAKPGAEAAQYDIVLTGAVLRYAHDVRVGRVRPIQVYEDVELPAANFDAAADLICNYDFRLIRSCEGSACCLMFLDRTKVHARRWCSMAVCGNRAKAEAYRARTARKRGRAGHGGCVS